MMLWCRSSGRMSPLTRTELGGIASRGVGRTNADAVDEVLGGGWGLDVRVRVVVEEEK